MRCRGKAYITNEARNLGFRRRIQMVLAMRQLGGLNKPTPAAGARRQTPAPALTARD